MMTLLPQGLRADHGLADRGLHVDLSTHLNWGSSYVVNDVYRRFYRPAAAKGTGPRRADRHGPLDGLCQRVGLVAEKRLAGIRDYLADRPARGCCSFCAGSGGGSTRTAKSPRWSHRLPWPSGWNLGRGASDVAKTPHRRGAHNRQLARGHLPDPAHGGGHLAEFLSADPSRRAGLGGGRPPGRDRQGASTTPARWNVPMELFCMLVGCVAVYCALFATGYDLRRIPPSLLTVVATLASVILMRTWAV